MKKIGDDAFDTPRDRPSECSAVRSIVEEEDKELEDDEHQDCIGTTNR